MTFYPAAEGVLIKGAVVICAGGAFQFRSESEGLPPTYYCYGTNDPFYRQFEAQFSMLENAGEPVERLVLENWGHGFGSMGNWMADYDQFLTEIFENN